MNHRAQEAMTCPICSYRFPFRSVFTVAPQRHLQCGRCGAELRPVQKRRVTVTGVLAGLLGVFSLVKDQLFGKESDTVAVFLWFILFTAALLLLLVYILYRTTYLEIIEEGVSAPGGLTQDRSSSTGDA
ncbi:MAG: hypothetical protein ACM3Q4_01060 [Acidobacteriota bacterium]